jgi:hypothetical protein
VLFHIVFTCHFKFISLCTIIFAASPLSTQHIDDRLNLIGLDHSGLESGYCVRTCIPTDCYFSELTKGKLFVVDALIKIE